MVAEYQTSSTYWSTRTRRQMLFTKPFILINSILPSPIFFQTVPTLTL